MLAGVLLLAKGSRGYRLVFRYPVAHARTRGGSSSSASDTGVCLAYGYEEPLLAEVLCPKSALCGRPFELVVDDLAFVGHPTLLGVAAAKKEPGRDSVREGPREQVRDVPRAEPPPVLSPAAQAVGEREKEGHWTMEMFNVVFVLKRGAFGAPSTAPFLVFAEQLASAIKHEELRCGFLAQEVALITRIHDAALASALGETRSTLQQSTFGTQQQQPAQASAAPARTSSAPSGSDPETIRAAAVAEALSKSALARHLRDVYEGLARGGGGASAVHVRINGWVAVGLRASASPSPSRGLSVPVPSIRPYHTLLLLDEQGDALRKLPVDASPLLRRVIQLANPLRSLQDVSLESGISLAQLLPLAAHLVLWGLASVINTISKTSLFAVSPAADLDTRSNMMAAFDATFKSRTLPTTLAEFSFPRQLGEHLAPLRPDDQLEMVHVVLWLLRRGLLLPLNTYALLVVPPESHASTSTNAAAGASDDASGRPHGNAGGDAQAHAQGAGERRRLSANGDVTVDPMAIAASVLSPAALAHVLQSRAASNKRDLALLLRLVPYLDGRHCMEEIMWRENLARSDIVLVLTAFRDVVVTCVHE